MYLKQLPMSFKASTNARTMNNNKSNTQQPFCKVCFDAKRDDYNTHFLKDFSGPKPIVLCPYLLAITCNYCKEQGHTVSYCEVLKAKRGSEIVPTRYQQQHSSKVPSQNGNFFILRVSDKKETVTHRETVSEKKRSVSTTNHFALLEDDDNEEEEALEWKMPKYNKTRTPAIMMAPREEVVLVAIAKKKEPEMESTIVEVATTASVSTWAKIVAMPPPPKKMAPPPSAKEMIKKDIASLFVTSRPTATPAEYEKPIPTFIHAPIPAASSSTDNTKTNKFDKYFFAAPSTTSNWADDDSSDEEDGW